MNASAILTEEWHPQKNGDATPSTVGIGSDYRAWWLSKVCGHEWDATVASRASGHGCPFCTGQRVLVGFNDLQTLHPGIASEWDFVLNDGVMPWEVTARSGKKRWWRGAACGHSWDATVASRTGPIRAGCGVCKGARVLAGYNDLGTAYPTAANDWHPYLNGAVTPADVTGASGFAAWWRGECGHDWNSVVKARTLQQQGCPFCAGNRALIGFNDLLTLFPDVASEWHPTKNGALVPTQFTPGTTTRVWWLGQCGHDWEASIVSRTSRNGGCHRCGYANTSRRQQLIYKALLTYMPGLQCDAKVARQGDRLPRRQPRLAVDMLCPDPKVIVEFDGWYFHGPNGPKARKHGLERCLQDDAEKAEELRSLGFRVIRIREDLPVLHEDDVEVTRKSSAAEVAAAVSIRLATPRRATLAAA